MRRALKRLALALLAVAGGYLVGVNLFLNTPLATRALSRSERFRIDWSVAWSVWPGRVQARGLELGGRSRGVTWSLVAERARGRIELRSLPRRTFRLRELHGEGVRARVARLDPGTPPLPPPRARPAGRPRWQFDLAQVVLDPVRQVDFHGLLLTGDGSAKGALRFVPGGEVRLEPTTLRVTRGEVRRVEAARGEIADEEAAGGGRAGAAAAPDEITRGIAELVRDLELTAEATLGPYRPREHPGIDGLAFLSGSLTAHGEVPQRALSGAAPGTLGPQPGRLAAQLRVAAGELLPGSRVELATRAQDATGPSVDLLGAVETRGTAPELRLRLAGRNLAAGGPAGGPALFRGGEVEVSAVTPERRLHHLFDVTRGLRAGKPLPSPLAGDVRAETVRIQAPGTRATLQATIDQVTGRLDLGALLRRHIAVEGLRAEGAELGLQLGHGIEGDAAEGVEGAEGAGGAAEPVPAVGQAPWSLRVTDARLDGLRQLALDDLVVLGDSHAETTLAYDRDGTFTVERFAVAMPSGVLHAAGKPAAEGLALDLEASVVPTVLGNVHGRALLRRASGTATLRGTTPSVAFLNPYLEKTPWLAVDGSGSLDAELRLAGGVLTPGTRLTVGASPARVTFFDSRAEGRGTITAAVEAAAGGGARTSLRIGLDRFTLAEQPPSRRAPYLRGRGLRVVATSAAALDLAGEIPDFDATFELPDAEVPDLAVYDALLPATAGLSLLSGRGRVTLKLQASSASRRATGAATLTSPAARLRFQNVEMEGRVNLRAPLVTPDLMTRRFDLAGARFDLEEVGYRDLLGNQPAQIGWWLRSELATGSLEWSTPMKLRGEGRVDMQSSGPLLALFADKSRLVRWFDDVLRVEDVRARGALRLAGDLVEVESLHATGGSLELRSRMRFAGASRRGLLYVRYGRLATGIELLDGRREYHVLRPREWYERAAAGWR